MRIDFELSRIRHNLVSSAVFVVAAFVKYGDADCAAGAARSLAHRVFEWVPELRG
jgi:hypothetical protein